MAKKPKIVKFELRIPIVILAQLEGVAAYAGVTVEQVINVAMAADFMRGKQSKPAAAVRSSSRVKRAVAAQCSWQAKPGAEQ